MESSYPSLPIESRAKRLLAENSLVLCLQVRLIRSADASLIAKACGFDALYIDLQHSSTALEAVSSICTMAAAVGITPLVRVPSHDATWVASVLDAGARGLVVPSVDNASQIETVLRHATFPPKGDRSVGGVGPASMYEAPNTQLQGRDLLVVAQIESAAAVQAAREIAQVDGVDVLMVGAGDLSADLGIPGQLDHPQLWEAFETVALACSAAGRTLGVGGIRRRPDLISSLTAIGARFLSAGGDVGYLMEGAKQDVASLRAITIQRLNNV